MIEIIPALDLMGGKCVRLSQGDFSRRTIYGDKPLEVAKKFEDAGLERLHVVDLDGAKRGKLTNLHVLETIATNTRLTIDFGGGIKTLDDLAAVFDAGASMAGVGSVAVKTPDKFYEWLEHYGSEKILLGADVRNGNLFVDGWQSATEILIMPFLSEYFAKGGRQVFVTDIAKDGCMAGPSIDLYRQIHETLPDLKLIASGGVSGLDDIRELEKIGCHGVIVGKAFYEGRISLQELAHAGNKPAI